MHRSPLRRVSTNASGSELDGLPTKGKDMSNSFREVRCHDHSGLSATTARSELAPSSLFFGLDSAVRPHQVSRRIVRSLDVICIGSLESLQGRGCYA